MHPGMRVATTGLDAQSFRSRVIANNLANVDTVGFKKDRANFHDMVYQTIHVPGGPSSQNTDNPSGLMAGTGVKVVGARKIHTTGNMVQTNNSLDLAIEGQGFFEILLPDGTTGYTRDGQFQVDAEGNIVTAQGFQLQPSVTLNNLAVSTTIATDGTVAQLLPGETELTEVANLNIVIFPNPEGLKPLGGNMFQQTVSSGAPQQLQPGTDGTSPIRQGFLEGSNVNAVAELVGLIEAQRNYEMNAKSVGTMDEMSQYATQVL